jgi:undecaprenyl-diphosphatase
MKWGWLLGAVALAGYLLARHRRLDRVILVPGWAAVAVAVAIGLGLIELPNVEELLMDAGATLGPWTYLVVGVIMFLETGAFVGLITPGETAVIVGGVIAGQGRVSLLVLIAVAWAAAVCGDSTSFWLGRRLGRSFIERHGPRFRITEDKLRRVDAFFERRGGVAILVGRFIGFVRPIAPFLAGASKLPWRRFLPYDVLGAGLWAATFCVLGYVFWRSFDMLVEYVSRGAFAFGTVVVVVAVIVWLARNRPGLLRPDVNRLTPGDLGLELTTMLALLAVGAFAFVFIGVEVGDGGAVGIDSMAADVASEARSAALVDVAAVVTDLGSLPVVALAAIVTALWATGRGRWVDGLALALGMTLSIVLVHAAKAAYGRPRPDDRLVDVAGFAYPSGHSLYAVGLVACAIVLLRGGSGWAKRFAAATVAAAIVALVGATRIYLGVHYLSDVLGGFAAGVAIWSAMGALALVGGHVRHNEVRR